MKQKVLSMLALLLMAATGTWAQADMLETPLTLEATTVGTIVVSSPQSGMQYSKNGGAKTAVTSAPINVAIGDKVQFFGDGTSIASYSGTNIYGGTADCYIYGNIMSLVDETGFATATTLTGGKGGAGFSSLFSDNSHLYNHPDKKLVLPATTLAESCYARMFYNCTHLTTAPELPATTLATGCYYNMFSGCTNLNSVTCLATDISATAATYGWLSGVAATGTFTKAAGMTGWTSGGNGIPAGWTVVDNVVLTDMLETPLTLEAKTAGTIKVSGPQSGMQYSKNYGAKTELTADAGYNSGDDEWTITVAIGDKVQFFGDGTSIASYIGTNISEGTAECYIYGNIMSLVDEEHFATATELTGNNAFSDLFLDNSQLYNHSTYKLVLPATTLAAGCYYGMFLGCTHLTTAPELPATTLAEACYSGMFYGCTNLTTAPELPATTLADECYSSMFYDCTNLTTAPALPATTLAEACYRGMFYDCTNLTTAPELPATTLAEACYYYMFLGCENLTTAPALPATTLANFCYFNMFSGCTSLTTAPALPATTLAHCCYTSMFSGCTSLNSVTCLATNISATDATSDWLVDVAADGTFTKAASVTDWTPGSNGIPAGWTKNNIATLTDGSSIADQLKCPGELCEVTYSRAFTADKPSTVCLPFAYAPKTGETFYTFSGISKDGDQYVATMTKYEGDALVANTPYLYKSATTGDTDFSGTYTMPATISAGETTSGDWTFVGTYETQEWTTAPTGIYGFSAQATTGGISQGEFVKVGAYVRIKPMRAYLKYKDGSENYAGAPMMAPRRADEVLPERISVRLIDGDGQVTAIGTLETRTGEVTLDGWYTLDGTRLSGQPTRKGIYVNNGKKVVIK